MVPVRAGPQVVRQALRQASVQVRWAWVRVMSVQVLEPPVEFVRPARSAQILHQMGSIPLRLHPQYHPTFAFGGKSVQSCK